MLVVALAAPGFAAENPPQLPLRATGGPVVALWQKTPNPNKPYIAQLFAPGDKPVPLLDDSPADHFHHHGLMFALNVDDTDFWAEKDIKNAGRQEVVETVAAPAGDGFTEVYAGSPRTALRCWMNPAGCGSGSRARARMPCIGWTGRPPSPRRRDARPCVCRVRIISDWACVSAPAWANQGEFIWADAATPPAVGGEKVTPR